MRSLSHQRGIVVLWAVIFLIVGVMITLTQVYDIAGSRGVATAQQSDSTAAFFIAESGLQRAQSILLNNPIDSTTCNDLVDGATDTSTSVPTFNVGVGGGSFSYPILTYAGVGSTGYPTCTVRATGISGSASRTVEAVFSAQPSDEGAGCGSSLSLALPVTKADAGAFTNTAYRAKAGAYTCVADPGNSNAIIGSCTLKNLSSTTTSACTNGWSLERTGTTNISSHGAYQNAPSQGNYSISMNLQLQGGGGAATRNYVVTGIVAYPESGKTVQYIGSYAADTGSNKTIGTAQVTGSIDNQWTCQPSNGSASDQMVRAANSDTLLYGFSSWPQAGSGQLNGLTLGIQPFRLIKTRSSNTGDNVYSQIWFTYNKPYYPTSSQWDPITNPGAAVVTGATNGADFSGTIGVTLTGATVSGTVLTLLASSTDIGTGVRIYDTAANYVGYVESGSGTIYTLNTTGQTGNTSPYRAYVLKITSAPSSGVVSIDDTVTNNAGTTTYGTVNSLLPGAAANTVGATYSLIPGTVGFPTTASLKSQGKTVTVPAGVASSSAPAVGTAVAVSGGTGKFSSTVFIGNIGVISGVSRLTSSTAVTLCEGDVLFGTGVRNSDNTETGIMPKTTITAPPGCTTGVAGIDSWTVSGTTSASSATIVARTGVLGTPTPSATSFKISRLPTTRLSGSAVVCGGICALFYNPTNVLNTDFTLSNVTSGDDWASGFACMSGVNSADIQTIGLDIKKRSGWHEVVN